MRFVVTDALPIPPTPAEEARRIVRHGLADVLEWLGEPVGPTPTAQTHMLLTDGEVLVSQELRDRIVLPFRGLAATLKEFGSFVTRVGPLLDPPASTGAIPARTVGT